MYFTLYKSTSNGKWYWRLKADNHKTIADGGQGYDNKSDALHGIELVKKEAPTAKVYDES